MNIILQLSVVQHLKYMNYSAKYFACALLMHWTFLSSSFQNYLKHPLFLYNNFSNHLCETKYHNMLDCW